MFLICAGMKRQRLLPPLPLHRQTSLGERGYLIDQCPRPLEYICSRPRVRPGPICVDRCVPPASVLVALVAMACSSCGSSSVGGGGEKLIVLSCDGAPVHPFAGRFPAPKKSKDKETDHVNIKNRDAGLRVVDFLLKYLAKAPDVWDFAQQLQKRMADGIGEHGSWSSQYKLVWRIGGDWWLEWICLSAKGSVERGDLLYFYHRDEKLIKQFAYLLTGLHGHSKLPPSMLRKQVASRVCQDMARKLDRMTILATNVRQRAVADFVAMSPYQLELDEASGLAVVVSHSGDKVPIVLGLQFPKSWKLQDPLSDNDCAALEPNVKGSHEFKKFFAAGQGPFKVMPEHNGFSMEEAADKFEKQIEKQTELPKVGDLVLNIEKVVTPEDMQKKRAGLERARAAVRANKARLEVGLAQTTT